MTIFKKLNLILILGLIAITLFGCGNEGNYPKDDGTRYATPIDAIYEKDNASSEDYLFSLEYENFVVVDMGERVKRLYKDEKGYFPITSLNLNYDLKNIQVLKNGEPINIGILAEVYYASKYVITFSTVSIPNPESFEIYDSIGSEILYGEYEENGMKCMTFFWVLDEIPEDYTINISGYEYGLPNSRSIKLTIVFGTFLGIPAVIVAIIIIMKAKRKNIRLKWITFGALDK